MQITAVKYIIDIYLKRESAYKNKHKISEALLGVNFLKVTNEPALLSSSFLFFFLLIAFDEEDVIRTRNIIHSIALVETMVDKTIK